MSDSAVASLEARIVAGDLVKPWVILGPYYENVNARVVGLSLFERAASTVGRNELDRAVEDAESILRSTPRECEQATYRGQSSRWELVRYPDEHLSWGTYNVANHLGAAFLSTIVTPDAPGEKHWRLATRISSRVIVAIGGKTVLDTDAVQGAKRGTGYEYHFTASLAEGDNVVTVGMFRIARMAQIGMRLEVLDGEVTARVPLAEGMSEGIRLGVEREVGGLSLGRDLIHPDDEVRLLVGVAPDPATQLTVRLETSQPRRVLDRGRTGSEHDGEAADTGAAAVEATVSGAEPVVLCQGQDLEDGSHRITCEWTRDGPYVTSTGFDIIKNSPWPAPQGLDNVEERASQLLTFSANSQDDVSRDAIWIQVSRYALGRYDEIDETIIRRTCVFIGERQDCADFVIQAILRLMYWERDERHLSPEINALMKDTILGFKYWVDEPGDTVMYMGSENHRLLFHVAEWMAGQLFPTEEFTNTGTRGIFHAAKGRTYITEWLRQRGRFGFDEWHSNSYFPVCIAPLANVYDFTIDEEFKLKAMTKTVLDYMAFILAADSYHGILGTTHGRSYGRLLIHPEMENTSPVCWLWFGTGSLASKSVESMAAVSCASGGYRPEPILSAIATDDTSVVESRIRQGLIAGNYPSANFCVYRTPDYLLSGLQDHRKGEYESSTHVAQVTLSNNTVIFWSCPLTSGEGSGLRPDYWSGHATMPRVIQYRNVMSLTWQASEYAWMTHCFFEQQRFDEVAFRDGGWAFARVGGGYVAIFSQHGLAVGGQGPYAGRELQCPTADNTWVVECGRESDWGSFQAFIDAVSAATPTTADDGTLTYVSPSVGTFVTGWDVTPTIDGDPVPLLDYPLVDSPWGQSVFGSGELAISYNGATRRFWFNQ